MEGRAGPGRAWARPGQARPGRDPARAVKGRTQLFFSEATFLKKALLFENMSLLSSKSRISSKSPPGEAEIDRERSHEFRDGLLVLTIPEMSSVALLTAEL